MSTHAEDAAALEREIQLLHDLGDKIARMTTAMTACAATLAQAREELEALALVIADTEDGDEGYPPEPQTDDLCVSCEHAYRFHGRDAGDRSVGIDGSEWCDALGNADEVDGCCPCGEFVPEPKVAL